MKKTSAAILSGLALALLGAALPCAAQVDHFEFSPVPAPGNRSGSHPYALFAGQCFPMTLLAKDSAGAVVTSYNGSAVVSQWLINYQSGALIQPVPGISQYSAIGTLFQLGLSSVTVRMTNGSYSFGGGGDLNTQLCFYYATRDPQDYNQSPSNPDQNGDFILRASSANGNFGGNSLSYLGWHNTAQKLLLTVPNQSHVPATTSGSTGTIRAESLGTQFSLAVRLVDGYWNSVFNDKAGSAEGDTVQLVSSHPEAVSLSPVQGAMTNGVLTGYATVISSAVCASTITLTVSDVSHPSTIAGNAVSVYISSCTGGGPPPVTQNPGFYQLSAPSLVTAGQSFSMNITVNNVNVSNVGGLRYSGRLAPLTAASATSFVPASGSLSVPTFDFTLPQGTVASSTSTTISNQSYNAAQTMWIQLLADTPDPELRGASAMAGPIQVLPAAASRITASASPSVIAARASSRLTVSLVDAFANGIPGATLTLQVTEGTQGGLGAEGITFLSAVTDALGRATLDFVSGTLSERVTIRVRAPFYSAIPAVDLSLLVSLLGDKKVAAYPNPANITSGPVTFEYTLDDNSTVTLIVTDLFGREVWRRAYDAAGQGGAKGFNKVAWDGKNGSGRTVAVGVYSLHMKMSANGQTTEAKTRFGVRK